MIELVWVIVKNNKMVPLAKKIKVLLFSIKRKEKDP